MLCNRVLVLELLLILNFGLFSSVIASGSRLFPLSCSLPRLLDGKPASLLLLLWHSLFRLSHYQRLNVILLLLTEVVLLCGPKLISLRLLQPTHLLPVHLLLDLTHPLSYQLLLLKKELTLLRGFRCELKRLLVLSFLDTILFA